MLIFHQGWSENFDGPGTRLIFYLKGCNFRCDWCASPESIHPEPELLYTPERNRDRSGRSCPHGALSPEGALDRGRCRSCGDHACTTIWRNPAFEWAGYELSSSEVLRLAEEARDLLSGVTFGGGEPTLQIDALLETLTLLRHAGFHTAVESNASTPGFRRLPGAVDLLFADLKTLDPALFRSRIGASGELVAGNLRLAAQLQSELRLRIPVVTGLNDTPAAQQELTRFCAALLELRPTGKLTVELLRQHHLGEPKYRALDRPYRLAGGAIPSRETLHEFAALLRSAGVDASVFA